MPNITRAPQQGLPSKEAIQHGLESWGIFLEASKTVASAWQYDLYLQSMTYGDDSPAFKEVQGLRPFYKARVLMAQKELGKWKKMQSIYMAHHKLSSWPLW